MKHVLRILAIASTAMFPAMAFAHAMLDHASPKVGSSSPAAPREVVLWFTENLEPAFSQIEVRSENGALVSSGKAHVDAADRNELRIALKPIGPGTYKVSWRVLSVDTHRTQGDFSFRVGP